MTPMNHPEAELIANLRRIYRQSGSQAAWALLDRMAAASEDGAGRDELRALVREAASELQPRH